MRAEATAVLAGAGFPAAAAASVALTRAGTQPSVAELLDESTLLAIDAAQGTSLRSDGAALLLVQADSGPREAALIAETLKATAISVRMTTDPAEEADLLAARRLALPSLERIGRPLIEDIAVPRSRLADAVREIALIAARHDVTISTIAHAGDGNLHPLIVADRAATTVPANAQAAADAIFELALKLGGTLTGEHGIGTLKRAWLTRELGETNHDLQRQLKSFFDPNAILNPGKAI